MWFLIRIAFWLSLVILLIPVDPETAREAEQSRSARPVGAFEAAGAAQAALDDMGGFCGRNPAVCELGGRLADTFMLKAKSGARWVYDYLDARTAPDATSPDELRARPQALVPGAGTRHAAGI